MHAVHVIERFRNRDPKPIYRRLREQGRQMPEGLAYIDSWIELTFERCFQLMGCDDSRLRRQLVEPRLFGAAPGFLEPAAGRCGSTDKILHAHDDHGRLAAPVDDEAFVVFDGEIHDLPKLDAGNVGVDAAVYSKCDGASRLFSWINWIWGSMRRCFRKHSTRIAQCEPAHRHS